MNVHNFCKRINEISETTTTQLIFIYTMQRTLKYVSCKDNKIFNLKYFQNLKNVIHFIRSIL